MYLFETTQRYSRARQSSNNIKQTNKHTPQQASKQKTTKKKQQQQQQQQASEQTNKHPNTYQGKLYIISIVAT